MAVQLDQANRLEDEIRRRMVSIYSFVSSSFDEETLHQIEGYSSNWETFTCSQCGEEYEVAYVIADSFENAQRATIAGKSVCLECLVDELDNYIILRPE